MHGSVLQNEDYIKFADASTVEVMSLGRLDEGIKENDKRAATYDAVDKDGNPVKYLVEWPGLTVEDIEGMRRTKAGQYNNTGKIPYTAFVNPHTEEEISNIKGGSSAGKIMEEVANASKLLVEQHGPSLARTDVRAVDALSAECNEILGKKGAGKALSHLNAKSKKLLKKGRRVEELVNGVRENLLAKAGEELDKAEELIDGGDAKGAKKILSSLKLALKKTDLEARVAELSEKLKGASAPAK